MKNMTKVILVSTLTVLGGCATIISGDKQKVSLQAIDKNTQHVIPDAKCSLTNSKGVIVPVYGNPGNVSLSREYGKLQANCIAKGYKQTGVGVGESFNAWTLVNVFFLPGFIVDAATGAVKKYPSHITVLMQKN
jgi:hypothetical protein